MGQTRRHREPEGATSESGTRENPALASNQDELEQAGELEDETLAAAGERVAEYLQAYLSLTVSAPSAYLEEALAEDEVESVTPDGGDQEEDAGGDGESCEVGEDGDGSTSDTGSDCDEEIEVPEPVEVTFQANYWTDRYATESRWGFAFERAGVTGAMLQEPVGEGRGSPAEMEAVVQAGLDNRELTPDPLPGVDSPIDAATWEPLIEAWMQEVGLGIDCSGFVNLALREVATISEFGGVTGMGPDHYHEYFSQYPVTGDEVQPLDLMFLGTPLQEGEDDAESVPRHIRVITAVEDVDGGREFTTAESTFAEREDASPDSDELVGRGPRFYEWRFESGTLFERHPGEAWTRSTEDPAFFRPLNHGSFSLLETPEPT